MEYYLSQFNGDGSRANPFNPRGNIPGWTMIDLRPRGDRREGYCLLATPEKIHQGLHLGDNISERLPETLKRKLQNSLGLTISRRYSKQLPKIIAELLTDHARADGSRWKSLLPERKSRRWKIYLGKEAIYDVPMIGGGVTITESWTHADDESLTADLTWTEGSGQSLRILTNQALMEGGGSPVYSSGRAESDVSSQNHYVQVQLKTFTVVGSQLQAYVLGRMTNANFDAYRVFAKNLSATATWELDKTIGGSDTPLESDAQDPVVDDTFRVECDGSSISGKVNTVTILGPVTDTGLEGATRTRGGIAAFSNDSASDIIALDNWEMGDLSVASATLMSAICM